MNERVATPGEPRRRWLRRAGWAAVSLLACTLLAGAFAAHRYRGLGLGLWREARWGTVGETRNLLPSLAYWLEFVEELEEDPATGAWDFPAADRQGAGAFEAGRRAYHRGDFARAVALLEEDQERRGDREEILFWLGMSHLRRAEAVNCLEALRGGGAHPEGPHGGAPVCSLPLLHPHERSGHARAAAAAFRRLLDRHDPDDRLVRWLLNFSLMTVGGFPGEVPAAYRIDTPFIDLFHGAGRRRAEERFGHLRFVDRARELGVDTFDAGRGVAVEDYDGDGWLDLVAAGGFDTLRYYRNRKGAGFEERTEAAGLGGILQPHVVTAADYDGDGRMDLFVGSLFQPFRLFRNQGGGFFRDATREAGLLEVLGSERWAATWVSAWDDVDGDGDLDLFLAQWGVRFPFAEGVVARPRMDSALLVNEGGVFRDRTAESGLQDLVRDLLFVGSAFGDYDADGRPDLFLSSPLWGTSALLRNTGGGRFERVLARDGGPDFAAPGFTAAFLDVDQDGRLDLFQGGLADARTSTELAVFGEHRERYRSGWSALYLQGPDGRLVRRTDLFGDALPMGTMGASFGDLDNDGCPDFYLGTGTPEGWFVLPNLLYLGERDGRRCTGRLANASMLQGFGTVQKGHGIVFADFDRDGDQDLYSALGGMWPGDRWPNQLFVNESRLENRWVAFRLRGRSTNRHGVGARIRVTAVAAGGEEIVRHARISNGTGFGSSPYLAHVGLLDAAAIREVRVDWPASGCTARYEARLDALQTLDEADCLRAAR